MSTDKRQTRNAEGDSSKEKVNAGSRDAVTLNMIKQNCVTVKVDSGYVMPSLLEKSMLVYRENSTMLSTHVHDALMNASISVFSTCFPTVRISYGVSCYSLNTSVIIGAPSGSNKGVMKYPIMMVIPLNEYLQIEFRQDTRDWEESNDRWEEEKKQAAKEGRKPDASLDPGEKPTYRCIRIPAITSKSMITDLIKGNERYGSLMDTTELDSICDSNSKDYGQMMDVFNKAAMNEPIEKAFRIDGKVVTINFPMLTVIASGTLGQVHRFITSYESGLGSRFPVMLMPDLLEFISQKPVEGGKDYAKYYVELGEEVLEMWLFFREFRFHVTFSDEQWGRHFETWKELFDEVKVNHNELTSLSIRFGLLHMRIAATLTMLREWDFIKVAKEAYRSKYSQCDDNAIECKDCDFHMAEAIATTLFEHSMLFASTKVPQYDSNVKEMEQWRWQYEVLKQMTETFSIEDFCAVGCVEPFNKSQQSCYRVLSKMSKGKQRCIKKLKDMRVNGKCIYQKVANGKK